MKQRQLLAKRCSIMFGKNLNIDWTLAEWLKALKQQSTCYEIKNVLR